MDDLVGSQPFTSSSSCHAILHVAYMSDGECHVVWRSIRVYEMRPSSGESSISYSLSLVEALFVWRYEDVVDAGSSGIFRHISHGATSIRVECAWVIQVNTVLHHDFKEALTVLLLRCFIDFEPCIRCYRSKSMKDVV